MFLRSRIVSVRFGVSALTAACLIGLVAGGNVEAQDQLIPGRNVNMVSGTQWPTGDPYLQRQNEPSVAGSTRNPLHLLAGANDYRTVDVPSSFALSPDKTPETGDAWLGLFRSFDGGQRWQSTLLPGYPQDESDEGRRSPLYGYQAGADPVVRAGTNGLFYFAGPVFDRQERGKNAIFVARFIDDNNREASFREAGYETRNDPVRYLGASLVTSSAGTVFYDKPWMAVDIPRAGANGCSIPAPAAGGKVQSLLAGNVYVAYTAFTEDAQGLKSAIYLSVSDDCGRSWSRPSLLSLPSDRVNQGATIALDPRNGNVYVAWRKFASTTGAHGDGFVVSKSTNLGRKFSVPAVAWALAQGRGRKTGLDVGEFFERWQSKRNGRSETGTTTVGIEGEISEFDQGTSDVNGALRFRTNMYPSMAVDGDGRVYLAWAERIAGPVRPDDARIRMSTSTDGRTWEAPVAVANEADAGHQIMPSLAFGGGKLVLVYYDLREDVSRSFGSFINDRYWDGSTGMYRPLPIRHTFDLRASFGTPGAVPSFGSSVSVSDYLSSNSRQLQFNPPNLPMFKQGTAPFMGDYVDVTMAPVFVPTANGGWTYNLNGPKPVFHAVWTDNRDVIQPRSDITPDGNPWNDYTAPTGLTYRTESRFDPGVLLPICDPLNTGSRNQNIYTARLTTGLVAGSPGNSKPLSNTLQRAFVVFAQNTTNSTKAFRLTIANQPPGGRASFDQFTPGVTSVDVTTPYRSAAARTVYVTSSDPKAQVRVDVIEIASAGGAPVADGLSDLVILNPDIANPDIANPDIANASLTDVTWTMTNTGNTTAAFNVNLFLSQQSTKICEKDQTTGCSIATQLILRKVYTTPAAVDCYLSVQSSNVLVANITNPKFVLPGETVPSQNDPSATNATLWLAPGETAKITLRIKDGDGDVTPVTDQDGSTASSGFINKVFLPTTETSFGSVTPEVQQQGVDTEDVIAATLSGSTTPPAPPLVTPLSPPVPTGSSDPDPTPLTLSFVQQPVSTQYGSSLSTAVSVLDQYGRTLPNAGVKLFL